ncbi:DUF2087 domain-containing protein [Actinopolymorpha sp. NPDC004070]|uniref:DUF2087 domain-containing protein n=1 Tax=Actinopolymorpha sp. NPDC004070 TaxID=3154548 RepID=UPI0033BADF73
MVRPDLLRDAAHELDELNETVREVHDDVATLRRLMVDVGVMSRDRNSVYALADEAAGASHAEGARPTRPSQGMR